MRNVQATLIKQWFDEVWNGGDEAAIVKLMAADAKAHGASPEGTVVGTEAFTGFFRDFRRQFHDIQVDVADVVCQDDMQCARTNVSAVHTATNTPVNFTGMCMTRIGDGKITEAWNNYDFSLMNKQLGL